MLDERVADPRQQGESPTEPSGSRRRVRDVEVCVAAAAEPPGVTMTTRVAGTVALEHTASADGVAREVTDSECRGTQRSEWSRDGRRLFATADLTCGDERRRVSGLTMLEADGTWLDVQSIAVAGRSEVRLRRYVRAPGEDRVSPPAAGWSIDAVTEASAKTSPAVLEAALVETEARFDLNGRTLLALDDRVPDELIDLMIALSYPERFVVERRAEADRGTFVFSDVDAELPWGPWFYSPFFARAYYAPFGYYYAPYYAYYPGAGPYPTPVIVIDGDDVDPPETRSGAGRVVDGLGYTRVRPRDAGASSAAASGDTSSSDTTPASSRGRAVMSSSGATQSTTGGSASGSSASSSENSSSSSGPSESSGGRTAQPR
jgi:hypothetical protein